MLCRIAIFVEYLLEAAFINITLRGLTMYCISYPKLCSFVTNNIVLLLMFTITHRKLLILTCAFKSLVTFVTVASYKRLCIIQKRNCLQLSSANVNGVVSCFRFFLMTELKKTSNISFLRGFQIMVSNERSA